MTTAAGWRDVAHHQGGYALGEHCYDSIHSLWLGQRLPELRVTENMDLATLPTLRASYQAEPPNEAFLCLREDATPDRRASPHHGLYRVLKTHLCVYYRHHLTVTDQVCDAPTVRVLRHILLEEEEHVRWAMQSSKSRRHTRKRRHAMEWQTELEVMLVCQRRRHRRPLARLADTI
jgi:hypothetical protein